MKEEKLGQESAFSPTHNYGMSKRLFLAGMAMQGLLSSSSQEDFSDGKKVIKYLCKDAFSYADELLRQEYGEETNK